MTEGEREEGVSQLKLWHVYNKAAKWPLLAPPLSRISMWNPAGRPRRPNFQVRADSKVFLWNKPSQGNVPTFKWHLTFGFHIICKAFMTSCGLCVPWTPRKPFSFCKAFELKLFLFWLGMNVWRDVCFCLLCVFKLFIYKYFNLWSTLWKVLHKENVLYFNGNKEELQRNQLIWMTAFLHQNI